MSQSPEPTGKKLSLFDATMLVMGGIIGVGIFFNPHGVAREVPQLGPYLAMWVLGGVAALAGAMTFAELAGSFPRTGGWFIFLREAFGALPAFLFAWIVLFVVSTGACAVIADFSAQQVAILVYGQDNDADTFRTALGVVLLVGVTALGCLGLKTGAVLQNLCMLLKLGAILVFAVAGLALAAPPAETLAALPELVPGGGSIPSGMMRAALPVLFSYGGWQLVTYIAPSIEDPARNLPRSIMVGVAGVVVVYLVVNYSFARALGIEGLATNPSFAAEVARRTLGPRGETLLVAAMAISSLGICTAILITTPGIYVAMSEERLFFARFGQVSPRTGAPIAALLVQGVVVLAYFTWARIDPEHVSLLTGGVVFAEWIFHFLCGAALLAVRARRPELARPFKSALYPLFPIVYCSLAAAVVVGTLATTGWKQTGIGLSVLAAGALIYHPWRSFLRRRGAAA